MGVDLEALTGDLTAIRNRLATVTGYRRLTDGQRAAVEEVRTRAQIALDRIAAVQAPTEPEPPDDPGPEPTPDPPADDEYAPPARARVVVNAPNGTIVEPDTHYVDPQGALIWSDGIHDVTVTGATRITTVLRGAQRLHIEGTKDRPIDSGPRNDGGDLLQIKAGRNGEIPEDITIRHWHLHDVSRGTELKHSDGVQVMCGRRIRLIDCHATNVDVQPYFVRDAGGYGSDGGGAGGGPIEDVLLLRCSAVGSPTGHNNINVAGDKEVGKAGRFVPTRVRIVDCWGDKSAVMDAAARRAGGEIINWRRI